MEIDKERLFGLLHKYAQTGGFDSHRNWKRLGVGLKASGYSVDDWSSLSCANAKDELQRVGQSTL
jgi:hypothetical protein